MKIANFVTDTFSCLRVGCKLYVKFDLRYFCASLPVHTEKTPFPGTLYVYAQVPHKNYIIFAHTREIIRTQQWTKAREL